MRRSDDAVTNEREPHEERSPVNERDAGEIKKTFIESTKRQRAYWTSLMLAEKKRTGDGSLNLSTWIIRQLPSPDGGEDIDENN